MGPDVERALRLLYDRAFKAGLVKKRVRLDIARPTPSALRRPAINGGR